MHGQRLRGERLVQLDRHPSCRRQPARAAAPCAWPASAPCPSRAAPRRPPPSVTHARQRLEASSRAELVARRAAARGAVVDARCVAGRHRAALRANAGCELAERLERRVRARVLVGVDRDRSPLLLRHGHRRRSRRRNVRSRRAAPRAAGSRSANASWSCAGYRVLARDVLGRLAHRVDAVRASSLGFTKRQPSVVSKSGLAPERPSAFGMTNGARDMLSTPPAITTSRLAGRDRMRDARWPSCPTRTAG